MDPFWGKLRKHLSERQLSNNSKKYIFPSEIVASFWRKETLRTGFFRQETCMSDNDCGSTDTESSTAAREHKNLIGALRSDNYLSWDKFKEEQFSINRKEKPANKPARTLFAADFLLENSSPERGPILQALINPVFAENSPVFLPYIVSILPGLSAVESLAPQTLTKELTHDLHHLLGRYKTFLKDNELFEPGYEDLPIQQLTDQAVLVCPEVLDDYQKYSASLEKSDSITIIRHERSRSRQSGTLLLFDNLLYEIRWMLNEAEVLLENKVEPDQIAVTTVTDDAADFLFREAALRGIPLLRKQGKNLLDYGPGRLFLLLQECYESGFSVQSLKKLLLHRGYPWKTPHIGNRLIRFGIDNYCLRNYSVDKKKYNIWTKNLERLGETTLLGFYKTLAGSISAIVTAPGYNDLKRRLNGFAGRFLDNEQWQGDDIRVFQRCFKVLDDLDDTASSLRGITPPPPFQMFLNALKEEMYVPIVRHEGIPVYPYRVSAGIYPHHHFIVGATQAGTEITVSRYPFLREDQKKRTGLTDIDLTDQFLSLYECSGKHVAFSCSKESLKGRELVPGAFVLNSRIEEQPRVKDRFMLEKRIWSGNSPATEGTDRLYKLQKEGFTFIGAAGFVKKADDFTVGRVPSPELALRLSQRRRDETGKLLVGHGDIADYQNCGFHYLFSYLLGLDDPVFDPRYFDPLAAGIFTHNVAFRLFQRIKQTDERFRVEKIDHYRSLLEDSITAAVTQWEKENTIFFPPVWNGFIETVRRRMNRFLFCEAETFPEFEIRELEKTETLLLKEDTVLLKGRIDRLSGTKDEIAVIDYKRSLSMTKKDCIGNDTLPTTYQMPFYAYLLEQNGFSVGSCSYYGMKEGTYKHLFGENLKKSWVDPEGMEQLIALMKRRIDHLLDGLREGDYRIPENECGSCEYRTIYREKYTLD